MGIIRKKELKVQRTAHLYFLDQDIDSPSELWIVLHGYGETAETFVQQFVIVSTPARLICAPEALSKFYVDGASGVVGASWMTSRERDDEIEDYLLYLDDVVDLILGNHPTIRTISVIGFSQGTATASRWTAATARDVSRLLLWGGSVATDIDEGRFRAKVASLAVELVVGRRDKYISEERLKAETERLAALGVRFTVHRFDGGHRLDRTLLSRLVNSNPA